MLHAVKENLQELYIAENQIKDADMVDFLAEPISQMPKLRILVLARNGVLSKYGSAGLLAQMAQYKQGLADQAPIALEKLDLTGTLLQDDGITEILPLIAEHFACLNTFLFNACRLTEQSGPALADFIENRFPLNRPLHLEMKL